MPASPLITRLAALLLLASCSTGLQAAELVIAVASNFQPAMHQLARRFEAKTGHRLRLVTGSTGKHYAQVHNGAPYDLFFAADSERPLRLEQEGLARPDSRFTYALGALVLWSPDTSLVDSAGEVLRGDAFGRLAIANPRLAPYGRAARETLVALGLWASLQDRLVRGENIAQAFHYVYSGNAQLGLIAHAQLRTLDVPGSRWPVPAELHAPIEQQAVLLKDTLAGRDFLAYVRSAEAVAIIRQFGYAVP